MSLFDKDLIKSDVCVPLRYQFAVELSAMIKKNHNKLLDAQKTHGVDSVMNCIHMYIGLLKNRTKYESMSVTGRDPWAQGYPATYLESGPTRTYCTYIKGDIYIVIHTGHRGPGVPMNAIEYGNITIILDKDLNEIKFRVTGLNS